MAAPAQPGTISGVGCYSPGLTGNYIISPVAGAASYIWTVPAGWTINSGQGTATINLTVGLACGTISVIAQNGDGDSPASMLDMCCRSQAVVL